MTACEPAHDVFAVFARLDGGVRKFLGDVAGLRRFRLINLLFSAVIAATVALVPACLAAMLLGGAERFEVALDPVAAEMRAPRGGLDALTPVQVAAAASAAPPDATPDDGGAAGTDEPIAGAAPGGGGSPTQAPAAFPDAGPGAAPASVPAPAPAASAEGFARVTPVPADIAPRPGPIPAAEETVPALGAVAGEAPDSELRASVKRRLGMRAPLERARRVAEWAPTG